MRVLPTAIPDVLILRPAVHADARGWFFEGYNRRAFAAAAGIDPDFVQDNHSRSSRGTLRGLHYQLARPQGKLVRVTEGEIYDVAVDIRRGSPTFGRWTGHHLRAEEHELTWIPPGFAHGFLVLSDFAEVSYKVTDYYDAASERSVLWNDPTLAIDWPMTVPLLLSDKDRAASPFAAAEVYA
ncbi:dTDP-4-dehydrorhamnose 3,5-epimerase [Cupriavidus plantarum]|uniref:dTDP-4-dehydrorhamnose 3,5-epimerase n=1 Tax=Cupriavidus plantarum TaxID=942865 RepID=UPI000EB2E8E7|nr:dTDP-4-dehydrorhamnose 3,5-epimerase [Cupriavidus plantarum]NYH98062.1 dTDP-4-dehydrorhamnose 3,5-epimerase [Cupriavidus plantarum]RLK35507.1 dTDP-4-dehydrorhamnose 3,5-epimerase [Cupriavidus plantarum]